jgi:hypothetical protein
MQVVPARGGVHAQAQDNASGVASFNALAIGPREVPVTPIHVLEEIETLHQQDPIQS